MTVTANGRAVASTDGDDVRVRVRVPENPPPGPVRPDPTPGSAHVRALQDNTAKGKTSGSGKIRNFVQLHAGEAKAATRSGWFLTEQPEPLHEVARTTFPAGAETANILHWTGVAAARTFRLLCHSLGYLICAATRTDKRAAVSLALTLLAITIALTVPLLASH